MNLAKLFISCCSVVVVRVAAAAAVADLKHFAVFFFFVLLKVIQGVFKLLSKKFSIPFLIEMVIQSNTFPSGDSLRSWFASTILVKNTKKVFKVQNRISLLLSTILDIDEIQKEHQSKTDSKTGSRGITGVLKSLEDGCKEPPRT